jgi:dTDP-4-amino-4,6-dideoxygalactose transaminase
MIAVTKAFLPPFDEYAAILKRAWDKVWITNNGELLQELEAKLSAEIGSPHVLFCGNGTVVLQLALKALNITGEVITTPFSYVATTNAILWEKCVPVFVDINSSDFCIDATKIEAAITPATQAILATHVYGNPCDVDAIAAIAQKHNLKVIYDAAHAFGVQYNDKQLLSYGDISTCSFHATKIFHTVEGGCLVTDDADLAKKLSLIRSFGHIGEDCIDVGINGKNSEFHAAMGLANLPYLPAIIQGRKNAVTRYDELLDFSRISQPKPLVNTIHNYAYYPVVFEQEAQLLQATDALQRAGIVPRRYFYPSLNTLHYLNTTQSCPISESVSKRVLCLPLFKDLSDEMVETIATIINSK